MAEDVRCRHFTSLRYLQCSAGVTYDEVKDTSNGHYPCFQQHSCSQRCEKVVFVTSAEIEESKREIAATMSRFAEALERGVCPECGQDIREERQVGRCVYAVPCGHRLFQGRATSAKKATPARRAGPKPEPKPAARNGRTLPAISLWQPWASLMASGAKRIETRSWPPYGLERGQLVVIHAAKRWTAAEMGVCVQEPHFPDALSDAASRGLWDVTEPPLGALVAVARFDRVVHTESELCASLSECELAFGDYSPGRYAWVFDAVRPLRPIPWAGKQRIFDVELPADLVYLEDRNEVGALRPMTSPNDDRASQPSATANVEQQEYPVTHCRWCNAPIIWARSVVGNKPAPIDAEINPKGNITLNPGTEPLSYTVWNEHYRKAMESAGLHMNHWVTCKSPKARAARRAS